MPIIGAQSEAWAGVEQRDADYLADLRIAGMVGQAIHRVDIDCARARAEGFVQGEVSTLSIVPHPRDAAFRATIGAALTEHCAEL